MNSLIRDMTSLGVESTLQSFGNRCLQELPDEIRSLLAPHLFEVEIERDLVLSERGATATAVVFPVSSIVSIMFGMDDGCAASIAMVGHEGIANYHLLFPHAAYPYRAVGLVSGHALAVDVTIMRGLLLTNRGLRGMFYEFGAKLHLQIASTLRGSLKDPIEKRLARCLLMHHDRIEGDDIAIFHSTLADMLGIRRASVTNAIHSLEGAGAVRDIRGHTTICDRRLLLELAGDAYGPAERVEGYRTA